jgi:hypothetical protein
MKAIRKIIRKNKQRHITGLFTHRRRWRLGVRSARSLCSHTSLTHIPARRVAAQRFMGGLERRKQPERYVKYRPKLV